MTDRTRAKDAKDVVPDLDLTPRGAVAARVSLPPHAGAGGDDDFELEIERGAMVSLPPSTSTRPSGLVSGRPATAGDQVRPSGLEVQYRRSDLQTRDTEPQGPTTHEQLLAYAVTGFGSFGTTALLWKLVHRQGGRSITNLLPHAFDASSMVESGVCALAALVLAIGFGLLGLTRNPRSYAMLGSGGTWLLASLAMITVTLVATDEHPTQPDGALLIPYVVPLGLLLLGVGVTGRAVSVFRAGGLRRGTAVVLAAMGGALVFLGLETSAVVARLS